MDIDHANWNSLVLHRNGERLIIGMISKGEQLVVQKGLPAQYSISKVAVRFEVVCLKRVVSLQCLQRRLPLFDSLLKDHYVCV